MARPSVSTLYDRAISSGITFTLDSPSSRDLIVNYDLMKIPNGGTLQDCRKKKHDFEKDIAYDKADLICLLEQRELLQKFLSVLSSDSIDPVNKLLLQDCKTHLDRTLQNP